MELLGAEAMTINLTKIMEETTAIVQVVEMEEIRETAAVAVDPRLFASSS